MGSGGLFEGGGIILVPAILLNTHIKTAQQRTTIQHAAIGTLAVDGWAVTFVRGDWAGPKPAQAPPLCTKCNSPPINGQCTNFILFDVALVYNYLWTLKGWRRSKLTGSAPA